MIRTTRTRARRKRPELFPNHVSQADRQKARLARLDEIRERWWKEGRRTCWLCKKPIEFRANYTLDHKEPGKMGGCKNDDESNLAPACWDCNEKKGSRRIA